MSNNFEKVDKNKIIPINKRRNNIKITPKKMLVLVLVFLIVFTILLGRVAWIQFVDGAWLKEKEYSQSTSSTLISAKRGTIYDSTGKALAVSVEVDTVSVNPELIKAKGKDGQSDEEATEEVNTTEEEIDGIE